MEFKEPTIKEIPTGKPSVETIEQSEAKKEIIKKAKKERFSLGIFLLQKLESYGADIIPLVGSVKNIKEIAQSRKYGGLELNARDRIVYSIIITSNLVFWALTIAKPFIKDPEINTEINKLIVESLGFTTLLMILQKITEGKRDVQELKKKLDFPQFLKNVQQFAEKYNIESLKEPLSICEKIIGEYGYDGITNLIIRANDKKLDANK